MASSNYQNSTLMLIEKVISILHFSCSLLRTRLNVLLHWAIMLGAGGRPMASERALGSGGSALVTAGRPLVVGGLAPGRGGTAGGRFRHKAIRLIIVRISGRLG